MNNSRPTARRRVQNQPNKPSAAVATSAASDQPLASSSAIRGARFGPSRHSDAVQSFHTRRPSSLDSLLALP
ncbi:hypothetical protein MLD38_039712 [Melastoma candidum]|uniref:Uncharacterized protein n=1 Tax=Melastoma candidum TaxID=119954 RepID=A0ACB9L468_9MYRT|nr:hypothetical protein MLD38_039712 [Melastoma candidum]